MTLLPLLLSVSTAATPGLLSAQSAGFIYYVDQHSPRCSDSNPGTSEQAPWCTLQRAASVGAGDTVYVKDGTYNDPITSGDYTSIFFPRNSGTPNAPISFRAYGPPNGPRHRPTVTRSINKLTPGYGYENAPAVGCNGRNYITWDGFALGPGTDLTILNSVGCVAENLLIDKGQSLDTIGNHDGIRIQLSSHAIVRQTIVRNVTRPDGSYNASCVKLYDTKNVRIHNNELSHCGAGIFDKEGAQGNMYELNYIHDTGSGIRLGSQQNVRCAAWNCAASNNTIRQNIIVDVGTAVDIAISDSTATHSGNQIFNNTIYNAGKGVWFEFLSGTMPGWQIYNNIVHTYALRSCYCAHYVFRSTHGPMPDLLTNFSNFWSPDRRTGFILDDVWGYGGRVLNLRQWQAYEGRGYDADSTSVDPHFAGPLSGMPRPSAFQLSGDSPVRNAGRVGGVPTGARVNMGAYVTGEEVVGVGKTTTQGQPSSQD